MLFDASVTAVSMAVTPSMADENGEPTSDAHIILSLALGLGLPVSPTQMTHIPAGMLRVPIGREMALKYGQELVDLAMKMPEPPKQSDIVIPDSPAAIDEAAKLAQQFKK